MSSSKGVHALEHCFFIKHNACNWNSIVWNAIPSSHGNQILIDKCTKGNSLFVKMQNDPNSFAGFVYLSDVIFCGDFTHFAIIWFGLNFQEKSYYLAKILLTNNCLHTPTWKISLSKYMNNVIRNQYYFQYLWEQWNDPIQTIF